MMGTYQPRNMWKCSASINLRQTVDQVGFITAYNETLHGQQNMIYLTHVMLHWVQYFVVAPRRTLCTSHNGRTPPAVTAHAISRTSVATFPNIATFRSHSRITYLPGYVTNPNVNWIQHSDTQLVTAIWQYRWAGSQMSEFPQLSREMAALSACLLRR
jgi:hypothetical protein